MRQLTKWDEGVVHRTFPQLHAEYSFVQLYILRQ